MPVMKMENFKMVRLTRGIERLYTVLSELVPVPVWWVVRVSVGGFDGSAEGMVGLKLEFNLEN